MRREGVASVVLGRWPSSPWPHWTRDGCVGERCCCVVSYNYAATFDTTVRSGRFAGGWAGSRGREALALVWKGPLLQRGWGFWGNRFDGPTRLETSII